MGIDLASTDAPFGFVPYGELKSVNIYAIVTAYGTAVYTGDTVEAGGAAITTKLFGTIQRCAVEETGAAGSMLGAVVGLMDSTGMPVSYIAASTTGDGTVAGYAMVADHPDQLYIAQQDGDTYSLDKECIGLNVDGVSTTAGSTTTGLSGMEIDSSTANTTSTLAWKIVGIHPDDTISTDNTAGAFGRFIVKLNSAYNGDNTSGVGTAPA